VNRWETPLLSLCILLLSAAHASARFEPSAGQLRPYQGAILSLSDIHFNPFADPAIVPQLIQAGVENWAGVLDQSADTHISGYREETNYRLLVSTFERMYYTCPFPDFILFSGDLLAHNFRSTFAQFASTGFEEFVGKTLSFISWQLGQFFPSTQVLFTLGNNDAYDVYLIAPDDSFLHNTAAIYYHGYLRESRRYEAAFKATFLQGGQYTIRARAAGLPRVVAINSVFFSASNPWPAAGWRQLEWLRVQLEKARRNRERVWLITHIPPGVDVRSTLQNPDTISRYWDVQHRNRRSQTFLDRFMELSEDFSGEIAGVFSGHTHMDHFRLVLNEKDRATAFVHITPALSPQYGNNPAFQLMSYDAATLDLLDVITYYFRTH